MALCPPLRQFLVRARDVLRQGIDSRGNLTFVIGNESADLDSITSSLVYSYIRSSSSGTKPDGLTYIPIINIPAADLKLRPELTALLPHAGLEASQLITLDDLPLADLGEELPAANTKWILVDHNVLQGKLGQVFGNRVFGVIDHHDDEHKAPQDTGSEPRIIQKAGSCSSLVVNYLKDQWQSLENSCGKVDQTPEWSVNVARLASASILIDTANLADKNKVTDHDREAMTFLKARNGDIDESPFYKALQQAKQDIGPLSLTDILRKDYKQWDSAGLKLGVASVVKSLEYLGEKAAKERQHVPDSSEENTEALKSLVKVAKEFARHRSLDLMVIMTTATGKEGKFQRQILVCAMNQTATRALRKFETTAGKELELVDMEDWSDMTKADNGELDRIWQQKAVQHSRKRVAPLLREAIEQSTTDSQL